MNAKNTIYRFTISIAGLNIRINTVSPSVYAYCIQYLSDNPPDICINICEEDIENAKNALKSAGQRIDTPYLETIVAYKKILDELITYNSLLIHGAVVAVNNEAYLFSAPSGTGKTTHIKQWIEKMDGAIIVNGDKPLVKITDNEVIACGTPWCGKERLGTNIMVPLKAFVYMERDNVNHINEISFLSAFPYLLQQTYRFSDQEKAKKTINLLTSLNEKISFWHFYCNNFKEDCFSTVYNSLICR